MQTMNFVDEEDVTRLQIRQEGDQVAGFFDERASAGLDMDAELVGDHVGESRLAETGRSIEEKVIHGLSALASGLNGNLKLSSDFLLTDIFREAPGAEAGIE